MISRFTPTFHAGAFCTGVFLCLLTAPSFANKQLDGMKQEIERQQQQINVEERKYSDLRKDLKSQEIKISTVAKDLHKQQQQVSEINTHINKLTDKRSELNQEVIAQKELLKQLIDAQYRQGKSDGLQRWLGSTPADQVDRLAIYAEALSQARIDALISYQKLTQELERKQAELSDNRAKQERLLTKQQKEKRKLEFEQAKRKRTLGEITKRVKQNKSYLSELKQSELALKKEMEKIAKLAAQAPVSMKGLSNQRRKLPWPVKGRVIHNYGEKQSSELRWKGVVIASSSGTSVKAIAPGKVVFADWLRGYGLMLVIDHGKGDMSLYGYNQTLLKKAGDTVQRGENVALVGNSGGQSQSALYFEIRRKGKTTNPKSWLK
ncbi:peptidoglycan DD-metalloendopeptidase family protein [Vibrio sp. SS-MA-C1-2]|uniref:peptidoglycan DD-metalloendopeptidase family protein n=1 Tax=Vibrio sp. SS-MA-C1-2 TaxID=2908646 RepID=UPI001F2E6F72|nr:peptidoglycan DD-metalloendopeptidase family protein [Vibrio sp. SS-MA-C1-2]UJF19259.1 peptidoglycan DD-metalloendopeptidase family protein [Vibrio sp. SS-MA-C1-2]